MEHEIKFHRKRVTRDRGVVTNKLCEMLKKKKWTRTLLTSKVKMEHEINFHKNTPVSQTRWDPLPTGKIGSKFVPGEKNTLKFHPHWKTTLKPHPNWEKH